jgi:hypothetical protein
MKVDFVSSMKAKKKRRAFRGIELSCGSLGYLNQTIVLTWLAHYKLDVNNPCLTLPQRIVPSIPWGLGVWKPLHPHKVGIIILALQ